MRQNQIESWSHDFGGDEHLSVSSRTAERLRASLARATGDADGGLRETAGQKRWLVPTGRISAFAHTSMFPVSGLLSWHGMMAS
jgi:hypothetical protein